MKPAYDALRRLLQTTQGLQLEAELDFAGSWRGLFDAHSIFWKQSTTPHKIIIINRLLKFLNCKFDKLIYLYAKTSIEEERIGFLQHSKKSAPVPPPSKITSIAVSTHSSHTAKNPLSKISTSSAK